MGDEKIEEKQEFEVYVNERDALHIQSREESGNYLKYLVTLSGGALILSLNFISEIAKDPPANKPCLILAWSFLSLSLGSILFSTFFSSLGCDKHIDKLDELYTEKGSVRDGFKPSWHTCAINWLNSISLISLIAGVIFLIIFVSTNL